jgi:beta-glucosidase
MAGDTVTVTVDVQNTGRRAGDEVVQLYLKAADAGGSGRLRSLGGFERVALRAGETKKVQFALSAGQFAAT